MLPSLSSLAAAGVTAAALAAAPPALAADRIYGGTTSAGEAIVVRADAAGKALRSIVVSWAVACSNGDRIFDSIELTAQRPIAGFAPGSDDLMVSRNAGGRFAGTQLTSFQSSAATAASTVTLAGTIKKGRASGTLSAVLKIVDKESGEDLASCDSGKLAWTATRSPGIVFAGVSSQDAPVVIRYDRARRRIADFLTTWTAPCSPGGMFREPDHLVRFPVKRTGAFGNPFGYETNLQGGGRRSYAYTLRGRATARAIKGTLGVTVIETDSAGAPTGSCDSGAVTFKAATG